MTLKYLLYKEVIQICRNKFLPRLIIIFPMVIMCVMPWVMNMEITNITVVAVDNDRTSMSSELIHKIGNSGYFKFNGLKAGYEDALNEIERSNADMVVEIPKGFERDFVNGKASPVLIAVNAVNGTKGSIGGGYMSNIVTSYVEPTADAINSKVSVLYLYNKHLNYKVFMIPSLIAIIMMLMCGFLPALNIVGEKEKGTIEAMNVTPVSKWNFILAKLIPYWVIALFVMSLCLFLAWIIYGITSVGNLGWVYLLAMTLALGFSGLGLVISNYNDTMQQAVFVMWFFVVCLMLLSGLFTPVRSMPDWAYTLTYINPIHYFIDAIRTIFVRGGDFDCIKHQIAALCVFAVIMNCWAIMSYRKNS